MGLFRKCFENGEMLVFKLCSIVIK